MENLSRFVRKNRRKQHLTQFTLANRSGLSVPTVRMLENGRGSWESFILTLSGLGFQIEIDGEHVGKLIKRLRKGLGLSKGELSRRSRIPRTTIIDIERRGTGYLQYIHRLLSQLQAEIPERLKGWYQEELAFHGHLQGWVLPWYLLQSERLPLTLHSNCLYLMRTQKLRSWVRFIRLAISFTLGNPMEPDFNIGFHHPGDGYQTDTLDPGAFIKDWLWKMVSSGLKAGK